MLSRVTQIRDELKRLELDAIIITHIPHIRYIANFTGSAGTLLITPQRSVFFTDFRYKDQAAAEIGKAFETHITSSVFEEMLKQNLFDKTAAVGFQESYTTVSQLDDIKRVLKENKIKKTKEVINRTVSIKTSHELMLMQKAADITDKVFSDILDFIKPGMTEIEVANHMDYLGRSYGAECAAFDMIVASGERSALPHGRATDKKIKKGEVVTLDFGFKYKGFCSDMTRTICVGKPTDLTKIKQIYNIVLQAHNLGIANAKNGITGKSLDDICRAEIKKAGYGDFFGHSTGHGLGLEVHEMPPVSQNGGKFIIKEHTVITIEPGIYLPGEFGVRIEDDIVIGRNSSKSLNKSPKEFIII